MKNPKSEYLNPPKRRRTSPKFTRLRRINLELFLNYLESLSNSSRNSTEWYAKLLELCWIKGSIFHKSLSGKELDVCEGQMKNPKSEYLNPPKRRQISPKWFDRLTILSKVEGQSRMAEILMTKTNLLKHTLLPIPSSLGDPLREGWLAPLRQNSPSVIGRRCVFWLKKTLAAEDTERLCLKSRVFLDFFGTP